MFNIIKGRILKFLLAGADIHIDFTSDGKEIIFTITTRFKYSLRYEIPLREPTDDERKKYNLYEVE